MRNTTDYLFALLQYLLPKRLITQLAYRLTRMEDTPWNTWVIKQYIKAFNVDMSLAEEPDPDAYITINQFFTRQLREGIRPLPDNEDIIISPVDGAISQLGPIQKGRLYQAKGHNYKLEELLGGSEKHAAPFQEGEFMTIYLSPKDYHRIHMPISGQLREMIYVPGELFSVNARTARTIPALFSRNERVIAFFDTAIGPMAMILVGAIIVGSIETVWAGEVNNSQLSWNYEYNKKGISLERGDEMGRFNMGSTVILLFGPQCASIASSLKAESSVVMGQEIGRPCH